MHKNETEEDTWILEYPSQLVINQPILASQFLNGMVPGPKPFHETDLLGMMVSSSPSSPAYPPLRT